MTNLEKLFVELDSAVDDETLSRSMRCMIEDLRLAVKDKLFPNWQK